MTSLSKILAEERIIREKTGPATRLVEKIYSGYMTEEESFKKKKTFAPSGLFYGSGACAKRWFISFNGANFEFKAGPLNVAGMRNGVMSHERIQEAMEESGVAKEIEKKISLENPPIFGYVDVIIDYEGEVYVGEIKTTNHQNFEYRRSTNKIANYHLAQVLIYMHALKINKGVVIYESKNTNELHAITFEMTPEYQKIIDGILEWCKEVYGMYENDVMPKRSFRKDSKVCKSCPVEKACNEVDGDVLVRRLSIGP
jgi:CRISPR/Cas system-associated exonuclease Cas4 (RecB family)